MDPNTTAIVMRDETADLSDRVSATLDLIDWLRAGGFPQSIPGRHFGGNTAARLAARAECNDYLARLAPDYVARVIR